jgi:hypothetical protein
MVKNLFLSGSFKNTNQNSRIPTNHITSMDKVQENVMSMKDEVVSIFGNLKEGKLPNEKEVRFLNLLFFG